MTEAYFDFLHVVQIPEDPTGVFDFSLADTSGSSSGEWIGDTGSKEGYSNTSVLSLNDMLSCKKQINIKSKNGNTVQYIGILVKFCGSHG